MYRHFSTGHSIGKKATDQTEIGFYFHEEEPKFALKSKKIMSYDLDLNPFEKDRKVSLSYTFKEPIKVYSLLPHKHYRGKNIKILAQKPNEKQIPLISIADYDFGYQYLYTLEAPLLFPKNTTFEVSGTYNNSYQPPLNPNPTAKVKTGSQSTDEMFIGYVTYISQE